MDLQLTGRCALVLGASRGLGEAIARGLAAEGVRLILSARDAERLEAVAASIRASGGAAETLPLDLGDAAAVAAALARATAPGATPIDILVANSGGPPPGPVSAVTGEQWQQQFTAMVAPVLALGNGLVAGMRARGFGRILAIVSSGTQQPIPNLGQSNALRAAIVGWAKTLATEVAGEGVTVNCLLPGRIHTERVDRLDDAAAARTGQSREDVAAASRASIPAGRYGTPQEFADVAVFLASPRASYVTGSQIRVDGGMIRSV